MIFLYFCEGGMNKTLRRYKQAEEKRQRQNEKEFLLHKDKEVK